MQKINQVTSCPVDSFELTAKLAAKESEDISGTSEGYRRVRRSAAMIGLAISMGTTPILLPNQNDKAMAAEPIVSHQTMTSYLARKKAAKNSFAEFSSVKSSFSQESRERLTIGQTLKIPSRDSLTQKLRINKQQENPSESNPLEPQQFQFSGTVSIAEKIPLNNENENTSKVDYLLQQRQNYAIKTLKIKQKRLKESLAALRLDNSLLPQEESALAVSTTKANKENQQKQQVAQTSPNLSVRQPIVLANGGQAVYKVKPGDSLDRIARIHGVSRAELMRANNIHNPNFIKINQTLKIPQTSLTPKTESRESAIPKVHTSFNSAIGGQSVIPSAELIRATATRSVSPEELRNTNTALESQGNPYVEKLRADIQKLRQEYQEKKSKDNYSQPDAEIENPISSSSKSADSDWVKERLERQIKIEEQTNRNIQIQPQQENSLLTPANSNSQRIASVPYRLQSGSTQTNSSSTQNRDRMVRIQVGDTVGPELPPLSTPGKYLPDSPSQSLPLPSSPRQYLPDSSSPSQGFVWPSKGTVTSGYGWRWGRMHKGIDIAGPIGTPVIAAASGEVVSAGWNSGGYGNLVKVRHPDGSLTLYAHNNRIVVRQGQKVEQGQQIAEMGSTGYSTGPHLHFEIHPRGKGAVNPMAYLPR
jgi:murein DD-endopeptidase MepM/ murein hydrolase activator NlpD